MPLSHPAPRRRLGATALLAAVAAFGVSLLAAPPALAASSVYDTLTVTADAAVTAGDTVTVSLAATGLVDAYAYDLTVSYDPALLSFDAGSASFPAGGFGAETPGTGSVTFSGTRLGTSPGLTGDQTLVGFTFTALGAGSAAITVTGGSIVDSATVGTAITTTDPGLSATTEIAAAPSTGGGNGSGPGSGGGSGSAPGGVSGSDGASTGPSGDLARTGLDATPWLVVGSAAAVLVALGVVLILRRRQVTR